MDVQACLADRRRYERQIERLHQRYLLSSRLFELKQDDVSLASIVINRGKVARLLAREVSHGRYERRSRAGARPPGVYVLRRDVASYFDSIPIGRDSSLWPALEADLGRPLPALVEGAIRAEMHLPDGGLAVRVKGLPMGQPIAG